MWRGVITGAQAMVECLKAEGISTVFGYPGAAICPFYDSLFDSGIRHILVRQEQNAGHAASGYARMTGNPGVCVTTSGPGATNLITALATAYMDSIPLIAVTGQVATDLLGRDVFQEVDITGAAEPFTKYAYLVKNAADIPRVFKEAFHIAKTGRPGPVLIDLPIDVQLELISFAYPDKVEIRGYKPSGKGHPLQIKRLVEAVNAAKRPLVCAGGGVIAANAQPEIRRFCAETQIPVVSTLMGMSAILSDDPLYFGMLGMHGHAAANQAVAQADLLIVIGARVGDRALTSPQILSQRAKIAHIDIDPAEIGKNLGTNIPIVGDAKLVLTQMTQAAPHPDTKEWIELLAACRTQSSAVSVTRKGGCVDPGVLLKKLFGSLDDHAVVVADVGQNQIWSASSYIAKGGRFFTSGGMGTMGYSLPAAIGAKAASPQTQVVAVCGDGAFQMNAMELATMRQSGLDVKIVLMNNERLGMVRELQNSLYGDRQIAVSLEPNPDFMMIAAAYGLTYERLSEDTDIPAAIERMLSHTGCYLLECCIDPDERSVIPE